MHRCPSVAYRIRVLVVTLSYAYLTPVRPEYLPSTAGRFSPLSFHADHVSGQTQSDTFPPILASTMPLVSLKTLVSGRVRQTAPLEASPRGGRKLAATRA
jgi:hypothetical protein